MRFQLVSYVQLYMYTCPILYMYASHPPEYTSSSIDAFPLHFIPKQTIHKQFCKEVMPHRSNMRYPICEWHPVGD